jgi:hypothetical protein
LKILGLKFRFHEMLLLEFGEFCGLSLLAQFTHPSQKTYHSEKIFLGNIQDDPLTNPSKHFQCVLGTHHCPNGFTSKGHKLPLASINILNKYQRPSSSQPRVR